MNREAGDRGLEGSRGQAQCFDQGSVCLDLIGGCTLPENFIERCKAMLRVGHGDEDGKPVGGSLARSL